MDEEELKTALRMGSHDHQDLLKNANALDEILPSIQSRRGQAMTDEQLVALHKSFFPNDDKQYDSDDSIISNIDFMPDEEIQKKDSKMRECFASIATMNEENDRARMVCNIGKETESERKKRKFFVAMSTDGLTEKQRKMAEKTLRNERMKIAKKLNTLVQVFKEAENKKTRYLTCSTFSSILEVLAETISVNNDNDHEKENDNRKKVKAVDDERLHNNLKAMGIKRNFYTGEKGRSVENFIKKKVKQILGDENVHWIFNGDTFGFDFDAQQSIIALDNYYSLRPSIIKEPDNGKSIDPLAIDVRQLLKSAYNTERSRNHTFYVNENLKWALFESN